MPNLDSIAEFRVITNSFDAEYGKFSGAVMNAITKAGTNGLHGSAFEFLRNDDMDARNFFDIQKGPETQSVRLRRGRSGHQEQGVLVYRLPGYAARSVVFLQVCCKCPRRACAEGYFSPSDFLDSGGAPTVVNGTLLGTAAYQPAGLRCHQQASLTALRLRHLGAVRLSAGAPSQGLVARHRVHAADYIPLPNTGRTYTVPPRAQCRPTPATTRRDSASTSTTSGRATGLVTIITWTIRLRQSLRLRNHLPRLRPGQPHPGAAVRPGQHLDLRSHDG